MPGENAILLSFHHSYVLVQYVLINPFLLHCAAIVCCNTNTQTKELGIKHIDFLCTVHTTKQINIKHTCKHKNIKTLHYFPYANMLLLINACILSCVHCSEDTVRTTQA